jgi:hypothetical protein
MENIQSLISKQKNIDIGILMQAQCIQNEFKRYDALLRLFTLQQYLLSNSSDAFISYEKMQILRKADYNGFKIQKYSFVHLIKNIKQNGLLLNKWPIIIDNMGKLTNGSHRLACALHWEIKNIPIKFSKNKIGSNYEREWFEQHKFSHEVLNSLDMLCDKYLIKTGAAFTCIIWPPAQKFVEDIEHDLKQHSKILASLKFISINNLNEFIPNIYKTDDIKKQNIEKKIKYINNSNSNLISAFSILVENPNYRLKKKNKAPLSTSIEKLKKFLRDKYAVLLDEYKHDIIIYIGDNPIHNRSMNEALLKEKFVLEKNIK